MWMQITTTTFKPEHYAPSIINIFISPHLNHAVRKVTEYGYVISQGRRLRKNLHIFADSLATLQHILTVSPVYTVRAWLPL